jgi:hypothetical protein
MLPSSRMEDQATPGAGSIAGDVTAKARSRRDRRLRDQGVERPVHRGIDRDGAEIRQLREAREQPFRGLGHIECRVYVRRRHRRVESVTILTIGRRTGDRRHRQMRRAGVERNQVAGPVHRQLKRPACDGGIDIKP